jgi:hypothetical protein
MIPGPRAHLSFRAAAAPNTKHQTPSSREVPNLEPQTPKTDAGANGARVGFRAWSFVLLWSLEFGIWNFLPGLSASQKLRWAPGPPDGVLSRARSRVHCHHSCKRCVNEGQFDRACVCLLRGGRWNVAQIFNLQYRRIVFGRASDRSHAPAIPNAWQSATLRYSRV